MKLYHQNHGGYFDRKREDVYVRGECQSTLQKKSFELWKYYTLFGAKLLIYLCHANAK